MRNIPAVAHLGGQFGTGLIDVTNDPAALDSEGRWAVVVDFEGAVTCLRFARWHETEPAAAATSWQGPAKDAYRSSMDRETYCKAVEQVRQDIAGGRLYQANVCRILSAQLPDPEAADVLALAALLRMGNPAPFLGAIRAPEHGIEIATASPELYLRRNQGQLLSGPIKGTATTAGGLTDKDRAENVMIVDLVRNDLSRVCEAGSVAVPSLLRLEDHPGVVHLVSDVSGHLVPGTGWAEILGATFPPGSVSGAPKYTALQVINEVEPVIRGPYCGAIGWIDADTKTAEIAVGIRTFFKQEDELRFGTGAGITWGSDPVAEWEETELKARNLIAVAAQCYLR